MNRLVLAVALLVVVASVAAMAAENKRPVKYCDATGCRPVDNYQLPEETPPAKTCEITRCNVEFNECIDACNQNRGAVSRSHTRAAYENCTIGCREKSNACTAFTCR